jgi:hypothetical protein
MYKVMVQNSGKVVKKGEYLSFTIDGFPANTNLDYSIAEENHFKSKGVGSIESDANGSGDFSTLFEGGPGKYRISVRNYTMGTAFDQFTITE